MVVKKNFFGRIAAGFRAFRLVGAGASAFSWFWNRLLAGTRIDYVAETGRVYDNSVVSSGIAYFWRQSVYLRLTVRKRKADDPGQTQWEEVPGHGLARAFESPIYYDRTTLLHGTLLNFLIRGNAYWRKIRSRSGQVVGFVLLPYHLVEPKNDRGNEGGTRLVTHYCYRPPGSGVEEEIAPEEIVHFRHGMDPEAMAMGLSPLYAALRSVYGENEASTLSAALMRNAGMSSVMIAPKEGEAQLPTDPEKRQEFKDKYRLNRIGDGAGEATFLPFPAEVHNVGFSPEQLVLTETRALEVSRICAGLGFDPMVLGLPSDAKRFANFEEAVEAAWEGTCAPILTVLALQIEAQCLFSDFGGVLGEISIAWDASDVPARQEDEDALFARAGKAYRQDDLITKNEARRMVGLGEVDGGEKFYSDAAVERFSIMAPAPGGDSAKAKALRRRWRLEESGGGIESDEPVEV